MNSVNHSPVHSVLMQNAGNTDDGKVISLFQQASPSTNTSVLHQQQIKTSDSVEELVSWLYHHSNHAGYLKRTAE